MSDQVEWAGRPRADAAYSAKSGTRIIDLSRISRSHLETRPYRWAAVDGLFSAADASALAGTFPNDHFKRVADHAGKKRHEYRVRSLIRMRSQSVSKEAQLSSAWQALGHDFLSPAYRKAMSALTGIDLHEAELEVNVFHYPPGGLHEAHTDHPDKIVTHVWYFNESWNDDDGGCLLILRFARPSRPRRPEYRRLLAIPPLSYARTTRGIRCLRWRKRASSQDAA